MTATAAALSGRLVLDTNGFVAKMQEAGAVSDRELKRIQKQVEYASAYIKQMERDQRSAAEAMGGFGALAARVAPLVAGVFSVAAVKNFIVATAQGIDRLNDFADATGVTIAKASALEDAALRTGTSFDAMETAVLRLNKELNAATPGSAIANTLKSIGLEAEDLRKQDPADAIRSVAKMLGQYADDGNKARLIQDLFGKSTREVAKFMHDLADVGETVGTVTAKQAAEAKRFNEQLAAMAKHSEDTKRALLSALLPAMNDVLERFNKANKEGTLLVDTLKNIAKYSLFGQIVEGVKGLGGGSGAGGDSEVDRLKLIAIGLENVQKTDRDAGRVENETNSRRLANIRARIAALEALGAAERKEGAIRTGMDQLQSVIGSYAKPSAPAPSGATPRGRGRAGSFDPYEGVNPAVVFRAIDRSIAKNKEYEQINKDVEKAVLERYAAEHDLYVQMEESQRKFDQIVALAGKKHADPTGQEATENAITDYLTRIETGTKRAEELVNGSFSRMEDAIVNFTKTGKLSFSDLFSFMADEYLRNMIRMAEKSLLLDSGGNFIGFDKIFSGLGSIGSSVASFFGFGHANGLSYVPYDGYPAILHEGERVQTRLEASGAARADGAAATQVTQINVAAGPTRAEVLVAIQQATRASESRMTRMFLRQQGAN